MRPGDKVWTEHHEPAVIERAWDHNDDSYDWWVNIYYIVEGQEGISKEPRKTENLSVREQSLEDWRKEKLKLKIHPEKS